MSDKENLDYKRGTFETEVAIGNPKPKVEIKAKLKSLHLPRLACSIRSSANANEYLHFLKDAKSNAWSLGWVRGLREGSALKSQE